MGVTWDQFTQYIANTSHTLRGTTLEELANTAVFLALRSGERPEGLSRRFERVLAFVGDGDRTVSRRLEPVLARLSIAKVLPALGNRYTKPIFMAAGPAFGAAYRAKLSAAGGTAKEQSGESRSAGLRLLRVVRQCFGESSR